MKLSEKKQLTQSTIKGIWTPVVNSGVVQNWPTHLANNAFVVSGNAGESLGFKHGDVVIGNATGDGILTVLNQTDLSNYYSKDDLDVSAKGFLQLAGSNVEALTSADILDATGTSNTKAISQDAATAAIDAVAGDLEDLDGRVEQLEEDIVDKVDKVTGKGLSTEDFSTALKNKLEGLEGTHFRGVFVSLNALETTIDDAVAGDYADVDTGVGADAARYIYDASDDSWVVQGSATSLTAAQVKNLYESNNDTNAFSDQHKADVEALEAGAFIDAEVSPKGFLREDGVTTDVMTTGQVKQATGSSTTDVMSQDATSKELAKKLNGPVTLTEATTLTESGAYQLDYTGGGFDITINALNIKHASFIVAGGDVENMPTKPKIIFSGVKLEGETQNLTIDVNFQAFTVAASVDATYGYIVSQI